VESRLTMRLPRARIGLLTTGHEYYWRQFPRLQEKCLGMARKLTEILEGFAEVVVSDLIDTVDKSEKAGRMFREAAVDILFIFPLGYTTSMMIVPAVQGLDVPIRIINAHEDRSYDYHAADTTEYLYHEGVCCIPEYAGALVSLGRAFRVRTGHFGDRRLREELACDVRGAAAARAFRHMNFALLGQAYTNMTDMPIDECRLLRTFGRMLVRPEVEEIEETFHTVAPAELESMYAELRALYDVDATVTNDHLRDSARLAVAYQKVIEHYDIWAFGYYWWGVKEGITLLRSRSNLAVSRLASMGRPGVTEGDVKSAMGIKLFDLLGAGGMFAEFFSVDYDENFILMGHDGPSNINMAVGKPKLRHLDIHHGKSGHGLGIDFDFREGPVTLLNLTQNNAGQTFNIIYTTGEIVKGPVLGIGNPNCRVRLRKPIQEFMNEWCQHGPSHHVVIGYGDRSLEIEVAAESLGFRVARV